MLEKIGRAVLQKFKNVPYVFGYIGKVIKSAIVFPSCGKAAFKILIMQLLFTFIEALSLIVVLSLALGSAIFILGNSFLLSIGQSDLIYQLLVVIIAKELGPILVAFVVTARSATAIATEIAGMVTTHQIESYVSIGVDPVSHLAVPRFLGVTLSVFFLNLYFSFAGLCGPYVILRITDPVTAANYFHLLFANLSLSIIGISILKSLIFGMVISIVATYFGFNVERASTEVPIAGIQAVGNSFFFIIATDILFIVLPLLF